MNNEACDPLLSTALSLAAAPRTGGGSNCDVWGVPDRMFGPMPETFYGAVGRVVMLNALLEDRLRGLLQTITFAPQTAYAKDSPGRFIPKLRQHVVKLPDVWAGLDAYLDGVDAALDRRNDLVHSLWQHDGADSYFGHRLDRSPKRATTTRTLVDLREEIGGLVRLIDEGERWYAVAGSLPLPGPSAI